MTDEKKEPESEDVETEDGPWWSRVPRKGFTQLAGHQTKKKRTNSHGSQRGPDMSLPIDVPITE
jgi:hypothetical protein